MQRVCLVTVELPGFGPCGGIGAAFEELSVMLSRSGHDVTILYCGPLESDGILPEAGASFFRNESIDVIPLDAGKFTGVKHDFRADSYAVWRTLRELDGDFDVVHFHDYRGLGFYACEGKRQGIALQETELVVQLHGPTRWTIESNRRFFFDEAQLLADHLERGSVEMADVRVSPSAYLADWARSSWGLSEECEIETIPNLCALLERRLRRTRRKSSVKQTDGPVRNLVIFGRHEDRKGIDIASSALSRLNETLAARKIKVHFVGQQGMVNGQPSALYFTKAAASWRFDYSFNFGLNRFTAGEYIASLENALVVVPAPIENSPYAVLEPLILGLPVLSSEGGGGVELIAPGSRSKFCCRMDSSGLSVAIERLLDSEELDCRAANDSAWIEGRWLTLHDELRTAVEKPVDAASAKPLVTVGITHFERPHKMSDALISMLKQDYENLEIIVIDDGSTDPDNVSALDELDAFMQRAGVTLLREENRYLGAARNTILEHAKGEYIVFLDDDDIALPHLVSTLVRSATRTRASVTPCFSHYLKEDRRAQFLSGQESPTHVDYFPSAGPLSLSLEQNVFGTATALIRIDDLKEVGGYTELRNVGNEDFELYVRLAQAKKPFAICPLPLFMYEVGRPSMLSATSMDTSFKRCFDAVEFDHNSAAWSDYSNLNVGRRLGPLSSNRQRWLNSFHANMEERNRLCDHSTPARDYVQIAARVAAQTGVERLSAAFRCAFDTADRLQNKVPEPAENDQDHHILQAGPSTTPALEQTPVLPRKLRRVRHNLVIGDLEAGLQGLDDYLRTTCSLDETILVPLRELGDVLSPDSSRSRIAATIERLRGKRYRGSIESLLLVLARVAHRHELHSLIVEIAQQALRLDRAAYRKRYADIGKVDDRGRLNALRHFRDHGRREGRVGFTVVSALLDSLTESSGTTYVLEDFEEVLNGTGTVTGPAPINLVKVEPHTAEQKLDHGAKSRSEPSTKAA